MKGPVQCASSHRVSTVLYKEQPLGEEITVLVVCDHKLFSDGLRTLLQSESDIIMLQASYAQLERYLEKGGSGPTVVLFDGEGSEDASLLNQMMLHWLETKFIVISPFLAAGYRKMPTNMRGVVVTSLRPSSVAQTIRMVIRGNWFVPIEVVQRSADERLTL